jgi:hypothetical protein
MDRGRIRSHAKGVDGPEVHRGPPRTGVLTGAWAPSPAMSEPTHRHKRLQEMLAKTGMPTTSQRAVSQPTPAGSSLETAAEPASRHPEAVTKSVLSPPDRCPAAGLLWVGGFRSWPGFDPDTDLSRPPVPPLSDEGHLVDPRRVGRPPCFAGNQGVPNLVRCPDGVRRLLVMAQHSQRSRDAFPPTEAGNDCRLRIRLCLTLKPFDSLRVRSRPPSPRASFPTWATGEST